jgi:hypothetical protein
MNWDNFHKIVSRGMDLGGAMYLIAIGTFLFGLAIAGSIFLVRFATQN